MRLLTLQLLLAIAVANARNDPPPSADRTWSPPNLSNYESELAEYHFNEAQGSSHVLINPRKIYGLAELIDIAERNNPETRVAWERARQAAAAVGLSESAYYPFLVASAAAGYDRAFIPFPHAGGESAKAPNESKSRSGVNHRWRITGDRVPPLPRRVEREMVVARFRRAKRCRRGGPGTIDDG